MLRFSFLGPFEVLHDEIVIEAFVSTKVQALLAYLAYTGRSHSRQALAGLLWAEVPEKKALGSLRVSLSNIRRMLPGTLSVTRVVAGLDPDEQYWIDTQAFDELDAGPSASIAELKRLVELVRGEFLEDLRVEGGQSPTGS